MKLLHGINPTVIEDPVARRFWETTRANFFELFKALSQVVAQQNNPVANVGAAPGYALPLPVTSGGTDGATPAEARTNLGLGALATLDTVGSGQIDNRTRCLWFPCDSFFDADSAMPTIEASQVNIGDSTTFPKAYYAITLADASSLPNLVLMFVLPTDYSSGATWKLAFASGASGPTANIVVDYYVKTVTAGTSADLAAVNDITSTDNVVAIAGAQHTLNFTNFANSTGLSPGKLVRFQFRRNGGHASDNYTDSVAFLGLYFEYTADS